MSARQAFIPRPPSITPSSDTYSRSTEAPEIDGSRNMFSNGQGKHKSIAAFFGQKKTGTETAEQEGLTQGPGPTRAIMGTNRRSFDGILRPEITPMSIIPYPTGLQLCTGTKQTGPHGQTPRKTATQGSFEFPTPMTPDSALRGRKEKFGVFMESREDEVSSNVLGSGGIMLVRPEDEADMRASIGAGTGGGYMRVFEGLCGNGKATEIQASLEHGITGPVPVHALGGLNADHGEEEGAANGMFVPSSRPLDMMTENSVRMERSHDSQRVLCGTKHGMRREEMEDQQGFTKRKRQALHDPNEYSPISIPRSPPTPALPASSFDKLDPVLVAGSLFENIEEFVNLEEIEADWSRWRACTTEEWLKGADKLAQDYTDILNMVKDHLTEKVMAYTNMISSVDKRRTEVNRNIEIIQEKGNIVRENISKLATKK